ncbi:MAG: hypothetical protein GY913_01960 [Proteobacteria bacterium]|nr:hypothetical protein [Pseudomonadota bacterium]MCP4915663.1 hypothetical protein [Pseudomonadota bacterium]
MKRVRDQPGGGIEAIQDGARVTVWPGEGYDEPAEHPGLAWRVGQGALDGDPVWLEHRPAGARLAELENLSPPELGMVLLDVAEAIAALHDQGRHHGRIDADHIIVSHGGRGMVIGVDPREGSEDEDSRALRMLMAELWPATAPPPPDPGEEPAGVMAEALSGWLDFEYPDHTPFSLGSRSKAATPEPTDQVLRYRPEREQFDEIGLDLGPDAYGRGLLDRWATGSSLSGAHTGAIEFTRPGPDGDEESPRTSLLARLISPPTRPPDVERFNSVEGEPCGEIKRLIADEPLDPLPLPSSTPRRGLLPRSPTEEAPFKEPPTEPTRPTAITEEVSVRALVIAGFSVLLALLAATAMLAWVLL